MSNFSSSCFFKDLSKYRTATMGLSMILVILFHQHFFSGFPTGIFHNCGYWGVDVFLVLSGIGMVRSLKRNTLKAFYKRRILRLIPTCIIIGLFKCIIESFVAGTPLLSNINFLKLIGLDSWFIRAIVFYYAISPFLFYSLKKNAKLTLFVVTVVFFVNGFVFRVHDATSDTWVIERLFVFSFGMFLAVKSEIITPKTVVVSFLFLCVALLIIIIRRRPTDDNVLFTLLTFAVGLGTLSILHMSIMALKKCHYNILRFFVLFGKLSLELYLLHELIFKIAMIYSEKDNHPLSFLLSIGITMVVAFTCQMITERIKSFVH